MIYLKNVFVHCQNAVSRSVTIVLAYLLYTGSNLKDALSKLKENKNIYKTQFWIR